MVCALSSRREMTSREDERDWTPRALPRQSSFDLHHYNHCPVSVDEESIKSSGIDPNQVPWWTSKRFRLSVLCFMGFACLSAQRVNLSISMVCMVQKDSNSSDTSTTTPSGVSTAVTSNGSGYTSDDVDQCLVSETPKDRIGEFTWSKDLQGVLLGAFFWGYMFFQIPGVLLSERFGAKKVIAAGMFPVAILTVLTPPAARASPYLMLAVRVIIGLGEALMYPASQALWARWAPPWERSRLVGIALCGAQFGTALMFPVGGALCINGFNGGWASIFYIIGSLGFLWCVLWVIFGHDSPDSASGISDVERKYIVHSLEESNKQPKRYATPWRSVLTSGAVWVLIIVHMCGSYGLYMLLTQMPTYMNEVLKFDIKSNGVFSMLPYLCFWVCTGLSGLLADFFIFKNVLSVSWTRKVISLIGMVGPAACLIGLSQMDCRHQPGAVVLLCFAVGLSGFNHSGYFINHGDIAPAYAGTLFAVTNTAASISGILAPYFVSAITPNKTRAEWETAFYLCAGVYIFGALVYLVFGTGRQRYWAKVPAKSKDEAVALRKPTFNGHRKSRSSMRTTYFDNEESHVTIEYDPEESYAQSAIV